MSVALPWLETSAAAAISLAGIVGLCDAQALHSNLKKILSHGCKMLVVDLGSVVDIQWTCWGHLVHAARRIQKQGGAVLLWRCPDHLVSQLLACGWDRCFLLPDYRAEDRALLPDEFLSCLCHETDAHAA